jgi:hypothetical protein
MNTVNVIEITNRDLPTLSIQSFPDTPTGNQAAEIAFLALIAEYNDGSAPPPEDQDAFLDDGYFEEGDYWVGIVHSIAKAESVV